MTRRCLTRLVCGFLTVVLAAGLVGCGAKRGDAPQLLTVLLADLSGSSAPLRPAMEREVRSALQAAAEVDGRLVITGVTGDSDGDRLGEVVVDFRAKRSERLPDNEVVNANFRVGLIEEGTRRYRSWVKQHRDRRGSDYAGGLRRAADVLAGHNGPEELVAVGDGFSNGVLAVGGRGATLAWCRRAGREAVGRGQIPLLTDVPVRWVGGGHTDKRDPAAQTNLRSCWEEILHAEGAVTEPGWWQAVKFR